ncbi:hypothetical protein [Henriciella aquimarina]|uniref:hypothetical protein n=1 Tax=Henriciella aquimarina TaxID=545261 RepID=UPI001179B0AE|nr:hypothetical protein [Henriciella aquimarina]
MSLLPVCHKTTLSMKMASGKPGAVHPPWEVHNYQSEIWGGDAVIRIKATGATINIGYVEGESETFDVSTHINDEPVSWTEYSLDATYTNDHELLFEDATVVPDGRLISVIDNTGAGSVFNRDWGEIAIEDLYTESISQYLTAPNDHELEWGETPESPQQNEVSVDDFQGSDAMDLLPSGYVDDIPRADTVQFSPDLLGAMKAESDSSTLESFDLYAQEKPEASLVGRPEAVSLPSFDFNVLDAEMQMTVWSYDDQAWIGAA